MQILWKIPEKIHYPKISANFIATLAAWDAQECERETGHEVKISQLRSGKMSQTASPKRPVHFSAVSGKVRVFLRLGGDSIGFMLMSEHIA